MKKLLLIILLLVPVASFAAEQPEKAPIMNAFEAFILEKAKQYTGKAEEAIEKAVEIAEEEAPQVVREFLIWRAWFHGTNLFFGSVFFVVFLFYFSWSFKNIEPSRYSRWNKTETHMVISSAGLFFSSIGALTFWTTNIFPFIQVIVAPRVYILEEVMKVLQ